jgi:hypothetical protein
MMVMGVPARIKLPGGRPQRFLKKTDAAAVPAKTVAAAAAPTQAAATAAKSERSPASVTA